MTVYIEAPQEWAGPKGIFLAGGITDCPDWQRLALTMIDAGARDAVTVINPRRAEFPMNDPTAAKAQIMWEHNMLARAAVILFWFPASQSPQPIALFELGVHAAKGASLAVGADPRYLRREDVFTQLALERPDVPVFDDLRLTVSEAKRLLAR